MLMNRGDFFEGGFWVLLLGDFLVLEMMMMMKVCRERSTRKKSVMLLLLLLLAWCVNLCVRERESWCLVLKCLHLNHFICFW